MGKFGDKLRRERELRGVTLEEIAEATKIGTRSLRALEEEHFDRLPGGIFNKGFVRAYAKFLGLDEEQAVADFIAAQGEQQDEKPDVMAKMAIQAEAARRNEAAAAGEKGGSSNKLWVTCAILVLLTAGATAGLRYYRQKQALKAAASKPPVVMTAPQSAPQAAMNPPSGATADANLQGTAPQTDTTTSDSGAQPSSQGAPTASDNPQSTVPVSSGVTKPVAPTVAAPKSVQGTSTSKPTEAAAKAAFELQIHVSRATWLSIQADGKPATTETLRDSATKTVVAQDRVVLTTGNSVDVTCNGRSLGVLGEDNKRSQLRISADCKVN